MTQRELMLMMSVCVFQALVVVVILGWLFVPIYIKAGVKQTHLHVTVTLNSNTLNILHYNNSDCQWKQAFAPIQNQKSLFWHNGGQHNCSLFGHL